MVSFCSAAGWDLSQTYDFRM